MILHSLQTIVVRYVLFPRRMKPGSYSLESGWYKRFWLLQLTLQRHLTLQHPFYSSLYTSTFLWLLGAKVCGRGGEIGD